MIPGRYFALGSWLTRHCNLSFDACLRICTAYANTQQHSGFESYWADFEQQLSDIGATLDRPNQVIIAPNGATFSLRS